MRQRREAGMRGFSALAPSTGTGMDMVLPSLWLALASFVSLAARRPILRPRGRKGLPIARPAAEPARVLRPKKTHGRSGLRRFAHRTAEVVGRSYAFMLAVTIIAVWAGTGPLFHFSDTWQLVINTGTTIVTFLMVFLIQNTQNRDAHAIHLKLDELIRANVHARNSLLGLESMSDAASPRASAPVRGAAPSRGARP